MADRPATTSRKKPGRKRRVAGWFLLVLGVLITGVWGASRWWWFGHEAATWRAYATNGTIQSSIFRQPLLGGRGWFGFSAPSGAASEWQWLVHNPQLWNDLLEQEPAVNAEYGIIACYADGQEWIVRVAAWPFALAALLGGGWLVWSGRRARRRAMTGMCLKCGYDLAGLATPTTSTPPCPECGTVAEAAPQPHPPR
ncbi:MAG: hypothetical protein ACREJO_05645 [Phycisphaerales bacterium]